MDRLAVFHAQAGQQGRALKTCMLSQAGHLNTQARRKLRKRLKLVHLQARDDAHARGALGSVAGVVIFRAWHCDRAVAQT